MARLLCCSDWSFHASAHAYGCSSVPMTPLEPELLDEGCTRCDDESVYFVSPGVLMQLLVVIFTCESPI